jgi:hypothetical protein
MCRQTGDVRFAELSQLTTCFLDTGQPRDSARVPGLTANLFFYFFATTLIEATATSAYHSAKRSANHSAIHSANHYTYT